MTRDASSPAIFGLIAEADAAAGSPAAAPVPVPVEKRDAAGRLIARVGIAAGRLEGPCLFYAEDGETVVSRMTFRAGLPVVPPPPQVIASPFLPVAPSAPGDSPF
ncbi:hypothetical protein ABMY26_19390 [Azospirillum sp. HJ39]|uniref:hypothetical protein n=1 Tax=Azospirillum sp. HJ39 TaxID=3159496 RepID=UPI003557B7AC